MITEKMRNEAADFGNFIKNEISRKQEAAPVQYELHPALTKNAMAQEMKFTITKDERQPRNFFDDTRNHETSQAFINSSGPSLTTSSYRAKFAGMQDPEAIRQIQVANDCAWREMTNTHKAEWLKADYSQRDVIQHQHKFEKSYFDYQEAKFNYKQVPEKAPALRDLEQLEKQAHRDFKAFKAERLNISPNEQVAKARAPSLSIAAKHKQKPEVENFKAPELGSAQAMLLQMRQKHDIKQKPTMSMGR